MSDSIPATLLRFGIPSLDELIGSAHGVSPIPARAPLISTYGINATDSNATICVMGPDGVGKSIVALHMVSRYAADCLQLHQLACNKKARTDSTDPETASNMPCVLYVSTDLLWPKAYQMWGEKGFALDTPNRRKIPHLIPAMVPCNTVGSGTSPNCYAENGNESLRLKLQNATPVLSLDADNSKKAVPVTENRPGEKPKNIDLFLNEVLAQPGQTQNMEHSIGFVDLAARTAGDDWIFINRLLAQLPAPKENEPKHLVVIDAIEGLEVFSGERDAMGEERNRRSRIAQLVRTAADKCHLLLIVEEAQEGSRLAEEFVADVVIHMRATNTDDNLLRTVEVVKSRAQEHVSSLHDYVIAGPTGTQTGDKINPDQPKNGNAYIHVHHNINTLFDKIARLEVPLRFSNSPLPTFGVPYLDAMLGHKIEARENTKKTPHLATQSNVLALIGDVATHKTQLGYSFLAECFSTRSIYDWPEGFNPKNSASDRTKGPIAILLTTRLIDDKIMARHLIAALSSKEAGTKEARETEAREAGQKIGQWVQVLCSPRSAQNPLKWNEIKRFLQTEKENSPLLSSLSEKHQQILARVLEVQDLNDHPGANVEAMLPALHQAVARIVQENQTESLVSSQRLICRRLPARNITAAHFFHIVESAVQEARCRLRQQQNHLAVSTSPEVERWQGGEESSAIRLVIDDWSTIQSLYKDVGSDPSLLQFLLQYFEWQGLCTLVIDLQNGNPLSSQHLGHGTDLKGRVGRMIHTWHVSFFNEKRVAVTIDPPPPSSTGLRPTIRELRQHPLSGKLQVDPHFECYSGLDRGEPRPLPLQIRLFSASSGCEEYLDEVESLMGRFFYSPSGKPIVMRDASVNYEDLRLVALAQRGQILDYTQIVQVDEFWEPSSPKLVKIDEGTNFCRAYLDAHTIDEDGDPTPEDPFLVFQASNSSPFTKNRRRHTFFRPYALCYTEQKDQADDNGTIDQAGDKETPQELNSIPMMWDFGFLLVRRRAWKNSLHRYLDKAEADQLKVHIENQELSLFETSTEDVYRPAETVQDVWDFLEARSYPYRPSTAQLAEAAQLAENANPHDQATLPPRKPIKPVSWFEFFQACIQVAQTQMRHGQAEPVIAFDFDRSGTETLSCLILEICASELADILSKPPALSNLMFEEAKLFFPLRAKRDDKRNKKGLLTLLGNPYFERALLRALLLLFGVTRPDQFGSQTSKNSAVNGTTTPPAPSSSAVAVRHWYSTASRAVAQWDADDPLVPLRLPGSYSTRGDWFLTIANGSQSPQLAKSGIDLLSSTRSNLSRLQQGVGLPTRHIGNIENQRTRLYTVQMEPTEMKVTKNFPSPGIDDTMTFPSRHKRKMRYREVWALGARSEPDIKWSQTDNSTDHLEYEPGFSWLWRSRIDYYHRHNRILNQWLWAFIASWHRRRLNPEHEKMDAFDIYRNLLGTKFDDPTEKITDRAEKETSVHKAALFFTDAIDNLREDLKDATLTDPNRADRIFPQSE